MFWKNWISSFVGYFCLRTSDHKYSCVQMMNFKDSRGKDERYIYHFGNKTIDEEAFLKQRIQKNHKYDQMIRKMQSWQGTYGNHQEVHTLPDEIIEFLCDEELDNVSIRPFQLKNGGLLSDW